MSLGEGFRFGFRGVAGVVFLWKIRQKGKGVGRVGGVGWGQAKEPASQCATRLSILPFSDLPL